MQRKPLKDVTYTAALLFFAAVHVIVLLGVAVQGAMNAFNAHLFLDRFYGLLFAILGILFTAIVAKEVRRLLQGDGLARAKMYIRKNEKLLFVAGVLLLIQYLFRNEIFNALLYGGYTFTSFLVAQARLGILRILPLDLLDYGVGVLYWVGQAYFLILILGWIARVFTPKADSA